MAFSHSPKIVTDGLSLCLDVSDRNSYPGSGADWFDVSANKLTFSSNGTQTPYTKIGGVDCFDFNGSGYWVSDSGHENVDFGGDCTLLFWFYAENLTERDTFFEKAGTTYASYRQEIAVTLETDEEFSYYSRRVSSYDVGGTSAMTIGKWNFMGIKMSTGKTTAARTGFYSKNGASWTSNYTSRSSEALLAAGEVRIGTGYAGTVENGYVSAVYCYNKMLTDAEVLQNYNATKSRFGL